MLPFHLIDVFTPTPLSGNGLAVFPEAAGLSGPAMQALTREMRQFESVFLHPGQAPGSFAARIFTLEEELPFAGHPVLGAACILHLLHAPQQDTAAWTLELGLPAAPRRRVRVDTARTRDTLFHAAMDQGPPTFSPPLTPDQAAPLLAALNLTPANAHPNLPLQVVSTGLPYLILPLAAGLNQARITVPDLSPLLAPLGAAFAYLLDPHAPEGRTWDNAGRVEDIATGSAAGPAGAYLVRHGLARPGHPITIAQGRFLHRPSRITVTAHGTADDIASLHVSGEACPVGHGRITLPPRDLEEPAGGA